MSDFLQNMIQEVEECKTEATREVDRLASRVLQHAKEFAMQNNVRKSEQALRPKTARLSRSLKKSPIAVSGDDISTSVYFDMTIAPHAKFVVQGTRKVRPNPILERAIVAVEEENDLHGCY